MYIYPIPESKIPFKQFYSDKTLGDCMIIFGINNGNLLTALLKLEKDST